MAQLGPDFNRITETYHDARWLRDLRDNPYFVKDTRENRVVLRSIPPKASTGIQSYEEWDWVLDERMKARDYKLKVVLTPGEPKVIVCVTLTVPYDDVTKGRSAIQATVAFHKILGPFFRLARKKDQREEAVGTTRTCISYVGQADEIDVYYLMEKLREKYRRDDVIPPAKKRRF